MSMQESAEQWWGEASKRDQLAVVICGVLVVLYILFMLVLKPLYAKRDMQSRAVKVAAVQLAKTQTLAAEISGSNSHANNSSGSIVQQVDESLREFGLRLTNMQPNGRSDVRVRIDQVPFEKALPWVNHLEVVKGLQVRDLEMSASSQAGVVSITLRLHKDT